MENSPHSKNPQDTKPCSLGDQSPGQSFDNTVTTPRPEKGLHNPESDEWAFEHAEHKFNREPSHAIQESLEDI